MRQFKLMAVTQVAESIATGLLIERRSNENSEQVVYLSRARMETDEDLKKLHRIEVSVCGRIKNQTGKVRYDGHEPIYECEVPIQKITALAAE